MIPLYDLKIKQVGTIQDIQDRDDLSLITCSYQVKECLSIYYTEKQQKQFYEDYELDSLFVNVEDGEYTEIYGFSGTVPWLYKTLYILEDVYPPTEVTSLTLEANK